jgi:hypothetical protein
MEPVVRWAFVSEEWCIYVIARSRKNGGKMQNSSHDRFEPIPQDVMGKLREVEVLTHPIAKEILRACPRPTLYIDEIVDLKGMKFRVTRIKADGNIGLKMVPEAR